MSAELERFDIALVRAGNPGPYTLSGTNTWVVGRDPAWVVDPGPLLDSHLEAVSAEAAMRGGAGGIAVTHDHPDHVEALEALKERLGTTRVDAGPLRAMPLPGHSDDHVVYLWRDAVCFSGDAVLGEGSVFIASRLREYMDGLRELLATPLALICPGHGPVVTDPAARLQHYLSHREDRERRLLAALHQGLTSEDELLDSVWQDAPAALRGAALITLRAHMGKLREEDRLPAPSRESGATP
jgi:glyoxylase-like metal-dependent hydrolase (beta-lactamase superfamily II)